MSSEPVAALQGVDLTLDHSDTRSLGFKCPICSIDPLFWFFQEGCGFYRHAELKQLFRHHLFGIASFHRKLNSLLTEHDSHWVSPDLFDRISKVLKERSKELKVKAKALKSEQGLTDERVKELIDQEKWSIAHKMFAERGGLVRHAASEDPYLRVKWVKDIFINDVLINDDFQHLRRAVIADPGMRLETHQMLESVDVIRKSAKIAEAKAREAFAEMEDMGANMIQRFAEAVNQHIAELSTKWHESIRLLSSEPSMPVLRAGQDVRGVGTIFPRVEDAVLDMDATSSSHETDVPSASLDASHVALDHPFVPQDFGLGAYHLVYQNLEPSNSSLTTALTEPYHEHLYGQGSPQNFQSAQFQQYHYQPFLVNQGTLQEQLLAAHNPMFPPTFPYPSYHMQPSIDGDEQVHESAAVAYLSMNHHHPGAQPQYQLPYRGRRVATYQYRQRYSPYPPLSARPRP